MIRKQILLEPRHNLRLKALRAETGMSESEIMRRALEAFDPTGNRGPGARQPAPGLLDALAQQNERTARALGRAAAELEQTLRSLSAGEPTPIGEAGL